MRRIVDGLQLLFLAIWLGGMVSFGAVMAPVLFQMSPTRHAAGGIIGEVVARLNWLGIAATGFIIIVQLFRRRIDWSGFLVALALGLMVLNNTYVRDGLDRAQAQMERPIDEYAISDPLRVEYNRWHKLSNNAGIGAVLAGLVVLVGWPSGRHSDPTGNR